MPENYTVLIDATSEVHSFTGMWPPEKLNKVLELAEFEDAEELSESDLMDMCVMVLQDLDHQRAGELVLEAVFGDAMRPGVRQNLVDDLEEDKPWDDVADIAHQKGVFETLILLQQAFPTRYGTPDALRLKVTISNARQSTPPETMTPQLLLKTLADCLSDRDILIRLYGDEIKSGGFANAEHIIWWLNETNSPSDARTYELVASAQWFSSLQRGESY